MPVFKTTVNILKITEEDELYNINHLDRADIFLPPTSNWDYNREMQIEDVDIWEVIYESSGGLGVYAAWAPYAEFYLITTGWKNLILSEIPQNDKKIETYYGPGAQKNVLLRAKQLNIPINLHKTWVNDEQMWLYQ